MLRLVGIELESGHQKGIRDRLALRAKLPASRPLDPDDPEFDILRHALDETVGAPKRRSATEDQPERRGVHGHDGGECFLRHASPSRRARGLAC
jgi:hypothetical protein